MDNNLTKLNNLPDLPGLESVELSYRAATLCAAAVIVGMVAFLLPMLLWWPYMGDYRLVMILGLGGIVSTALWALYRAATGGCYWKTDSEGITERTLVAKRRIAWRDVERVEQRERAMSLSVYRLHAGRVHIDVPSPYRLGASVWRHLRLMGKSDGFILHGAMLSFWDTIPEDVLQPVEVIERVPDEVILMPVLFAMCSGTAFVIMSDHRGAWLWIALVSMVGLALLAWRLVRNAPERHYIMNGEALQVLGKRPRRIPWSSVTSIDDSIPLFYGPGSVHAITTDECRLLFVAPRGKDEPSQRAQLAWIKHTRAHGLAAVVPEKLRRPSPAVLDAPKLVDIRLPSFFVWFVPCAFGSLALLIPLMPRVRPWETGDTLATCFMATGAAILALAACRYHVRADESGLLKTTLYGTKRLLWTEVGSYENRSESGSSLGATLTDRQGRKLRLSATSGNSKLQWDALTTLMDRHLAHLLPPPEDQPSWLARPFSAE